MSALDPAMMPRAEVAPRASGDQDGGGVDAAALTPVAAFEERPLLAVATSGGPDSLALALFAEGWARRRGGRVVALIVDHGLRPESAAEARQVGAWLAARGIRHEVLRWEGVKPASGVQEAAREA